MPLHLLPKKSWNPYAPAAIARVRADEAAAAADEEADEQRQQQHDAAVRLALLRGETPPPELPSRAHQHSDDHFAGKHSEDRSRTKDEWSDRRKRRRLAGEDDTDRDIRVARSDAEVARAAKTILRGTDGDEGEFSLVDGRGNIQLFAPPEEKKDSRKNGRKATNAEAEAEKAAKEREFADQYTMRFDNAAGFKQSAGTKPWYATTGTVRSQDSQESTSGGKNVWGKDDPGRTRRDATRLASADPMAAMKQAQTQLRSVEGERERWRREKEREIGDLRALEKRRVRRDSLDGFMLDGDEKHRHEHKHKHSHRHGHGHRSRSRSPARRHRHRRER